jgi:flagellar M-ring protein FliF
VDPQTLLSRLRTLASTFSTTQLVTLAGTFVLVVGIVAGSAWWLNAPTYTLLYSDMDAESAQQIVTKLKAQNIPYKLDDGGRGIRVPQERVDELRLELSAESLPGSGRVGFEIFDRTQFGATQFLEQVNYRRALEGEIARTLGTIAEVSSARVHIAMGKDSLFGEPRPAKASVVLKLRGSRSPSAATIAGIGNLVASSVEGLRPESVVILDSYGRPLARPQEGEDDPLGAAHLERQQRLEREMSARVVALLEPVVARTAFASTWRSSSIRSRWSRPRRAGIRTPSCAAARRAPIRRLAAAVWPPWPAPVATPRSAPMRRRRRSRRSPAPTPRAPPRRRTSK